MDKIDSEPTIHHDFIRKQNPIWDRLLNTLAQIKENGGGGRHEMHAFDDAVDLELVREPPGDEHNVLNDFLGEMQPVVSAIINLTGEYREWGENVFVVQKGMAEAFKATELHNVQLNEVNFPYPCFYIDLPEYGGEVWSTENEEIFYVKGMYVFNGPLVMYPPSRRPEGEFLTIGVWATAKDFKNRPNEDVFSWFFLKKENKDSLSLEALFEKLLGPDVLQRENAPGIPTAGGNVPLNLCATQSQTWNELLRIAICTALYVGCDNAHVQMVVPKNRARRQESLKKQLLKNIDKGNNRQVKKLAEKLRVMPRSNIVYIGGDYERVYREQTGNSGTGNGQPRHTRVGHYHHFRVGKRKNSDGSLVPLEDQGLIKRWVFPIWVNDHLVDEVETVRKVYHVK